LFHHFVVMAKWLPDTPNTLRKLMRSTRFMSELLYYTFTLCTLIHHTHRVGSYIQHVL
jgi:hypothetical protein